MSVWQKIMNKDQLNEKINLQKKYANKIARIVIPPMLGFTGLAIFAVITKQALIYEHRIIFSSCCLIIPLSVAGTTLWLIFKNMRSIGLVCPNCKKSLYKDFQQTALTTQKCGKCGEIIITENNTSLWERRDVG